MNGRRSRAARQATGVITARADLDFVRRRLENPWLRIIALFLPRLASWMDRRAVDRYMDRRDQGAKRVRRVIGRRLG